MDIMRNGRETVRMEKISAWKNVFQVAAWELKHFSANRSSWVIGGAGLCFFIGLLLVRNQWGEVLGTTTLGQIAELVYDLMLLIGIILPFLATDRVAHDVHDRMHELLMTTALSTPVYILGRYFAALAISLCLVVAALGAQLLANVVFPVLFSQFPIANPMVTLILWIHFALPSAILIGSLSFFLGVLFPRVTAIPKLAVCIAWVILALDTDPTDLSWRVYWNPTAAGMITQVVNQYQNVLQRELQNASGIAAIPGVVLRLQQAMPVLHPWTGPFLAMAIIGLFMGLAAVLSFRRFQNSMNG